MKAIILAGGEGIRMRPYTENTPKPMLDVAGRPILRWLVDQLGSAGVREVVVIENYLSHVVRDYFDTATDLNTNIVHLVDRQPSRDTADLVKEAASVGNIAAEDFIIMAGDTLIDNDYKTLLDYHQSKGGLVTVVARQEKLPHGIFTCDSDNKIVDVKEKPAVIIPTATMVVNKSVIEGIDKRGDFFFNIVPYIESAGHIFEVEPHKVLHISEMRDDLARANVQWAELMGN